MCIIISSRNLHVHMITLRSVHWQRVLWSRADRKELQGGGGEGFLCDCSEDPLPPLQLLWHFALPEGSADHAKPQGCDSVIFHTGHHPLQPHWTHRRISIQATRWVECSEMETNIEYLHLGLFSSDWENYLKTKAQDWLTMNTFWFNYTKEHNLRMLVIFYQDLLAQFDQSVRRLSAYLGVELIESDLKCIKKHNEGVFHRKDKNDTFHQLSVDKGGLEEKVKMLNDEVEKCFESGQCLSTGSKALLPWGTFICYGNQWWFKTVIKNHFDSIQSSFHRSLELTIKKMRLKMIYCIIIYYMSIILYIIFAPIKWFQTSCPDG